MIKIIDNGMEKRSAHIRVIRLLIFSLSLITFVDRTTPLNPRVNKTTEYNAEDNTVNICSVPLRWNHQPVGRENEKYMDSLRKVSFTNCRGLDKTNITVSFIIALSESTGLRPAY